MNHYAQYFTNSIYSKLLVDNIKIANPKKVIDLGIGNGSLTIMAMSKWSNAKFYAIDIDEEKCNLIRNISDRIIITKEDGLKPNLINKIRFNIADIDVAICNPPYMQVSNSDEFSEIFMASSLNSCCTLKKISSDIIFLAQNLALLKDGGYLGIILPDGLLTRKNLINLRKDIIQNHTIKHIIQLPDKIFKKTEARTHILIIKKGKSNYKEVMLSIANTKGDYINNIKVLKDDLIERMDYDYQLWKSQQHYDFCKKSNIRIGISRGSYTYKQLLLMKLDFFHSIHFKDQNSHFFNNNKYNLSNKIIAKSGDILMCRVGKRCVGKVSMVTHGNILISDCVYRIRIPQKYRMAIWNYLNSEEGKSWINVAAHGVCSKVISKCDLLENIVYIISRIKAKEISIQA